MLQMNEEEYITLNVQCLNKLIKNLIIYRNNVIPQHTYILYVLNKKSQKNNNV